MEYTIENGIVYDNHTSANGSTGMLAIGNSEQYSTTTTDSQITYQWQKFNITTGIYEDDTTNSNLILGKTPTNGQAIIERLANVQVAKIAELEDNCTSVKDGGFSSSCLGTPKTFDSSPENRNLIVGLAMKASLIASGKTLADSSLNWKAQNEPVCYSWEPAQMIALGVDLSTFLTSTIKHKELLQQYVGTLTTVDTVNAVNWSTVIPTTTTATS